MKPFVSDELWQRLQPLLPPPPPRRFRFPGRKPLDYRKILTGILFVLKTGMAWEDLPAELGCGCGKTCRDYLKRWSHAGVWHRLHQLLLTEWDDAGQIDWSRAAVDAAFAKAPLGGEDTGPNPTDRGKSGSKHHVLGTRPADNVGDRSKCKGSQPTDPQRIHRLRIGHLYTVVLVHPANAGWFGEARLRCNNHRSGNHSCNASLAGFSPNANSPGNASRK